jgi:hypothetical protein
LVVKRLGVYALTTVCAFALGANSATVASTVPPPYHLSGVGSYAYGGGYDPATGLNADVQVQVGTTTFRPYQPLGFPLTIQTDLISANFSRSTIDDFSYGFGCWLIPADDYVINSDLSATLDFDSSDPRVTECPGDPVGPNGMTTSGLVVGLAGPVHIHVTWTATSPITSSRTISRESCPPYFNSGMGTQQNADAVATYVTSGAFATDGGAFSGNFQTVSGSVTAFTGMGEIKGFPGACGPYG